jgi:hypothetical protein
MGLLGYNQESFRARRVNLRESRRSSSSLTNYASTLHEAHISDHGTENFMEAVVSIRNQLPSLFGQIINYFTDLNITYDQYLSGSHTIFAILVFTILIHQNNLSMHSVSLLYTLLFITTAPKYFGYDISFTHGLTLTDYSTHFSRQNEIRRSDIRTISIAAWLNGAIMWVTEVFAFLPREHYLYFEINWYFPGQMILLNLFVFQLFIYLSQL